MSSVNTCHFFFALFALSELPKRGVNLTRLCALRYYCFFLFVFFFACSVDCQDTEKLKTAATAYAKGEGDAEAVKKAATETATDYAQSLMGGTEAKK